MSPWLHIQDETDYKGGWSGTRELINSTVIRSMWGERESLLFTYSLFQIMVGSRYGGQPWMKEQ